MTTQPPLPGMEDAVTEGGVSQRPWLGGWVLSKGNGKRGWDKIFLNFESLPGSPRGEGGAGRPPEAK